MCTVIFVPFNYMYVLAALQEMVHGLDRQTIRWQFIQSLESPRVVHVRTTEMLSKENLYAQVTVRLHTQQVSSWLVAQSNGQTPSLITRLLPSTTVRLGYAIKGAWVSLLCICLPKSAVSPCQRPFFLNLSFSFVHVYAGSAVVFGR